MVNGLKEMYAQNNQWNKTFCDDRRLIGFDAILLHFLLRNGKAFATKMITHLLNL